MVKQCNCKHNFQDKEYGKGMRVHNETKKKPTALGGWKCTVCGSIKGK